MIIPMSPYFEEHRLWNMFKNHVLHERRFTFLALSGKKHRGLSDFHDMLDRIGAVVNQYNLLTTLSSDVHLYRARSMNSGQLNENLQYNMFDIAAPPDKFTQNLRMSPAGISMFYASFDENTPKEECIMSDDPTKILLGEFILKEDLLVLDLTKIDELRNEVCTDDKYLCFLSYFHHEITKSIDKSKSSIDYVPSQIVTEYFRWTFRTNENLRINGIIYRSSKCKAKKNIVLFYNYDNCHSVLDLVSARLV